MIEYIRIKNYRSFENLRINLSALNILIGANDTGKSNFISAFVLLREMMRKPLSEIFRPLEGKGFEDNLNFQSKRREVSFAVSSVLRKQNSTPKLLRYSISIRRQTTGSLFYARESLRVNLENQPGRWRRLFMRIGKKVIYYQHSKQPNLIFEVDPQRSALWAVPLGKELIAAQKMREELRTIFYYNLNPDRIRDSRIMVETKPSHVLQPSGFNLAEVLYYLKTEKPEAFGALQKCLMKFVPETKGILLSLKEKRLTLSMKYNSKVLSVQQASDGYLRFLALLALTYSPASPSLVLIEEAENGIHPHRLRHVMDRLKTLTLRTKPVQIIVTTHSPYLVDLVEPTEIRIVSKVNNSTVIRKVDHMNFLRFKDDFTLGEAWFSNLLGGLPEDRFDS